MTASWPRHRKKPTVRCIGAGKERTAGRTRSNRSGCPGRADQIIEQARLEGEKTKREADEYVLETLTKMEMEMERNLTQVRNGIRTLQSEKQIPAR